MWEWLLQPIDPTRAHDLGLHLKWHGRVMVIAWGICVPLGVIAARFFKILPRQRFPEVVDNRAWWRTHLASQIGAIALSAVGLWLIVARPETTTSITPTVWVHRAFGWSVLFLGVMQGLSGAFRGSKGGPKDRQMRGDHYDMTPRREAFEIVHKTAGYTALTLSMIAVLTGCWQANAPIWMWIVLPLWWALMAGLFVVFERRGMVIDTYVAIWGPDAIHPGNRRRTEETHRD